MAVQASDRGAARPREQRLEFTVLLLLYVLQVVNAEMLRHAIDADRGQHAALPILSGSVQALVDWVHPLAMAVFGIWLVAMALTLVRRAGLARWTFDGLGLWFALRLLLEFLTINLLIFQPMLVPAGVLLGQIVLYLPYFVVMWGWIFYRLDWVDREAAGAVLQLNDIDASRGVSRFDYFHSTINTLLNKGKPTIIGISRSGRIAVLIFNGMVLALYAVAFTRILQLTKAAV